MDSSASLSLTRGGRRSRGQGTGSEKRERATTSPGIEFHRPTHLSVTPFPFTSTYIALHNSPSLLSLVRSTLLLIIGVVQGTQQLSSSPSSSLPLCPSHAGGLEGTAREKRVSSQLLDSTHHCPLFTGVRDQQQLLVSYRVQQVAGASKKRGPFVLVCTKQASQPREERRRARENFPLSDRFRGNRASRNSFTQNAGGPVDRKRQMASGGFVEEMMREQSLLEATCGDLFDHIDDLLDFPKEESAADVLLLDAPAPGSPLSARIIDVGGARGGNNNNAQQAAAPAMEPLMALPPPAAQDDDATAAFFAAAGAPVFDAKDVGGHIGPCEELDMDMAHLEWLLFDDASIPHEPAFPGINCAVAPIKSSALAANSAGVALLPPDKMEDALFRSSSPISVLEHNNGYNNANNNAGSASSSSSSASSSSESFSGSGGHAWSAPVSPRPDPPVLVIPARARSKRSRPSAFTGAARAAEAPTILVPTPMYSSTSSHSDPESIAESDPHQAPPMKKKKKAKKPAPPAPAASDADGDNDGDADYEEGGERSQPQGGAVRRCTHCQIEKTPQWRAGPLGPKTLCNACGVRYKSGRLFPEYRPAASPTFVPAIHSNSHKKVVEMRQKAVRTGDPSCDLLQFIRRQD